MAATHLPRDREAARRAGRRRAPDGGPACDVCFYDSTPRPSLPRQIQHPRPPITHRRLAAAPMARERDTVSPSLPWLALSDGSFFNSPSSTSLHLFPNAAGYHGSCHDSLLFSGSGDGDGYLLVNPFTGDTVRLPSLSSIRFVVKGGKELPWRGIADDRRAPCVETTTVRKVVMCPAGGKGELVAAIVGDGKLGKIAMCRPGGDGSSSRWVMSGHDMWRRIDDLAFYDGKLYAVEDTGNLFAMAVAGDEDDDDGHAGDGEPQVAWAKIVIKVSDDSPQARRRRQKEKAPPSMRYLLVYGGRLMMVHRSAAAAAMSDGDTSTTTKFGVFQADLVTPRWSETTGVGDDVAIFVGRWSSFALRVSKYKLPGNRIHFLDDDAFRHGCHDDMFGSYDMADGKIYPLLSPPLELCKGNDAGSSPATWLFPRPKFFFKEQEQKRVLTWRDLPSDRVGPHHDHLSKVCRDWRSSTQQHLRLLHHHREDHDHLSKVNLSKVSLEWRSSMLRHLRRRPFALAPAPTVAVATTAPPAPPPPAVPVAYLALPNRMIFKYPDLTSRPFRKNATGSGAGCRSYIAAACDDWLLFSDADGLFRLTSPFTGKTRHLPSFHDIHADDRLVDIINEPSPRHDAMATGELWRDDKTMAVRKVVVCPDGFIAAIFGREHFAKVALCSLETFSWTHSVHDRWRPYDDLACHGGKLYAVTAGADLLAIDVGVDGETAHPSVSRVERVIVAGGGAMAISSFHYLVPSDDSGELLMVRRRFPNAYAMGSSRSRFAVFRADLASARWEEVRYLGDGEAVFVGRMCSRKVRGRQLSGREVFFLPEDCVGMWSWEPRRRGDHHAAVYDMWNRRVTDILPRQLREVDGGPPMATWLFPTQT
ncbi:hypothetical protein HU200_051012 [Digitaria exilis]|uniref:KIB1-4 beta-propeller domain-containing protein n=1 Tax=Digitaria exilis TaxID=1010633 RepID=A0A835E9P6_9POAL|nr:hypothetical protein HU200_051012 [Digitaria exilis]